MLGDQDFGWTTSDIIIEMTRKKILSVLGTYSVDKAFQSLSHTNGASTRIRRGPQARIEKHGGKAHVTSLALKYWYSVAAETRLSDQPLELQECSELFTVPKSTDIDRVACKEPEINMLLQRSVGSYIRKRLRYHGIDLNDQSRNQRLAAAGLAKGLCTIDLSSASDSISRSLVMSLLPTDWWSVLDDLRAHYVNIDGDIHRTSMFSSMGNGFTFELESLIFWALTISIGRLSGLPSGKLKEEVSVYGDDIIAPSCLGPRLARIFNWFGFSVNPKKSHWSGFFRESCGRHYYRGLEVTPFYVREPCHSKSGMIRILNRLLQWDGSQFRCFTTPAVADFHYKWSLQVPRSLWGGDDPNEISSLVTGHHPSKRILWVPRRSKRDESLALESWFLSMEGASEVSSMESVTQGIAVYGAPECFRDRTSSCYDHGRVKTWDPYLICGPFILHHTS
jgi:hypothetical protein